MLPDTLSFVDIETTGTSLTWNRIIEIGIIRVEHNQEVRRFTTLINPEIRIDPFIAEMTGISQQELETAPLFEDVKGEILELLDNAVFVAHNVRFDYGFLRNELRRFDIKFQKKHFCTVKLAKLLYPGHRNYNLDSIIERFQIPCARRHRALDDAEVIWNFYKKAYSELPEDQFITSLNIALKRPSIPLGVTQDMLDALPECPGVYIFYGEDGMPLYIGKSINIRDRVLSHFSSDHLSGTDMKISQQIKSLETFPTAGELGALLLESTLIKKYQPLYNRQLRHARKLIALMRCETDKKYLSAEAFLLDDIDIHEIHNVIGIFKSNRDMKDFLHTLCKNHALCPKIFDLEKTSSCCFSYHLGQCKGACNGLEPPAQYNIRFEEAIAPHKINKWSFDGPILIKESSNTEEGFLIDKWCILGKIQEEQDIYNNLNVQYSFDYDTYKILRRYLKTKEAIKHITLLRNHKQYTHSQAFLYT